MNADKRAMPHVYERSLEHAASQQNRQRNEWKLTPKGQQVLDELRRRERNAERRKAIGHRAVDNAASLAILGLTLLLVVALIWRPV